LNAFTSLKIAPLVSINEQIVRAKWEFNFHPPLNTIFRRDRSLRPNQQMSWMAMLEIAIHDGVNSERECERQSEGHEGLNFTRRSVEIHEKMRLAATSAKGDQRSKCNRA
jgi:hypothetical protein